MATANSDDDDDPTEHEVARERPGVYVQVVASRKRGKKRKSRESDEVSGPMRIQSRSDQAASTDEVTAARDTVGEPVFEAKSSYAHDSDVEPDPFRGERTLPPRDSDEPGAGVYDIPGSGSSSTGRHADNSNHRADLMLGNVPAAPRVPNISLSGSLANVSKKRGTRPPKPRVASLLDAPHSVHPEAPPQARGPSWGMLAFVALLSAIIAAAGVVALRKLTGNAPTADVADTAPAEKAAPQAPASVPPVMEPSESVVVRPSSEAAPVQRGAAADTKPDTKPGVGVVKADAKPRDHVDSAAQKPAGAQPSAGPTAAAAKSALEAVPEPLRRRRPRNARPSGDGEPAVRTGEAPAAPAKAAPNPNLPDNPY